MLGLVWKVVNLRWSMSVCIVILCMLGTTFLFVMLLH